eukprot:Em0016g134a
MENYKRLQRLGRGAQGSVYVAEHLLDKKKYVIKMVECNDASEAGKAFKEVQALQVLKHPYICGYKESFVTWEKEEEAMYVCIVMDYYGLGDLARILRQHREKKEQIEDMTLRKWLGQMIEALHFIHGNGMIHSYDERSDVWSLGCVVLELATCSFLSNESVTGLLFQIKLAPQVVEEALDRVAKVTSDQLWWAPDVQDGVGCFALTLKSAALSACAMCECATLSAGVVMGYQQLWSCGTNGNHIPFRQLLNMCGYFVLDQEYSAALCHFIRATLRRAFQQRPTVKQLLELPYIQECLALSQSKLCTGTAKVETTIKEVNHMASADVLLYMEENTEDPQSQVLALKQLFDVIRDGSQTLDDSGKRQVLHTMVKFISNAEIQVLCCHMLGTLATTAQQNDVLFTKEFISPICLSMRTHAGSKTFSVQHALSLSPYHSMCLGSRPCFIPVVPGFQTLLCPYSAWVPDPVVPEFQTMLCCRFQTVLCPGSRPCYVPGSRPCFVPVVDGAGVGVANAHLPSPPHLVPYHCPLLREAGCLGHDKQCCVSDQKYIEHTAGLIGEIGGIQDILATMRTFPNEEDIVTSCCSALWSLSVCESNVAILSKEKGPHDICEALKSHIGCVSLVESACSALWSLSMEESNLTVMDDLHIVELLLHVLEHFMENVDIAKVSCAALASLVEVHDPPAFHILHTRDGKEGVPILLKALNTHLTHGEVVENIAILFQEMTRHSEIEEELASMHVKEALTSCNKKLPLELQNTEAHSALSDAIVALESRLKPKEGGRARSARKASAAIRARGVM